MGGFFLDDLIRSIVHHVRRETRLRKASNWPDVDATISRFTFFDDLGHLVRPVLTFSYHVKGELLYGSAQGHPINAGRVNEIGEAVDSISTLRVRYDPADPASSRLLNQDNPKIPFDIDHLVS